VRANSTIKTKAILKLFADRELVAEREIEVQKGINNFAFTDTALKGGLVTYSAVIEAAGDTLI
jgi:hypothetical protein